MLLSDETIDLAGVVTVFGEVGQRAYIAAKLLDLAGRGDVPVACGLADPLRRQSERLGWVDAQTCILTGEDRHDAIVDPPGPRFMRDQLAQSPAVLLAIGPLTNVGALLRDYPEVKHRIQSIVIMGGLFASTHVEWNMGLDPEAAQLVFSAGIPMRVVPFDVTCNCRMRGASLARIAGDSRPLQAAVARLISGWRKRTGESCPVLHDPLAVGALVAPELYRFEPCEVDVVLEDGPQYGTTSATPKAESPVQVCTGVDYDAFGALFEAGLFREPFQARPRGERLRRADAPPGTWARGAGRQS